MHGFPTTVRSRLVKWRGVFKKEKGTDVHDQPIRERLKDLFDRENIPFRFLSHTEVYTAPELAESIHVSGWNVAKAVLVCADGRYAMAVLPSPRRLDLNRLEGVLRSARVFLAKEWEMKELFPDCEVGAMPPLGNLYGLRVVVDASLAREPVIYFPAGSHHEVIEMLYRDFERLVHPRIGDFVLEPLKKAGGF